MDRARQDFIGELIIRAVPRWQLPRRATVQLYQLQQDFGFHSRIKEMVITAPRALITDFASVPGLSKWLFLDDDSPDILFASVIHDCIYSARGIGVARTLCGDPRTLHRRHADEILREAMLTAGAPAWKVRWVYLLVRLFGKSHWK